ncbi:MAG: cytochrome c [Proteobacteria bacterium]|nr:cytochrome c [Pseudomonadota bacterium]MCH9758035.1 cytochrome c [Pseudomonadota bacterium]
MKLRLFSVFLFALLTSGTVFAEQPGSSTQAKSNQCIGCHEIAGYKNVFPKVYPIPKIVNQSAAFIEYALKAYRSGERIHPSMSAIAAQLSDEDIKALAAFYAEGAK